MLPSVIFATFAAFMGAASAGIAKVRDVETTTLKQVSGLTTRAEPWVEITLFNDWDFKGSKQQFRTVADGKCCEYKRDVANAWTRQEEY